MDDLIERLRDPPSVHEFDGERLLYALCSEAADALEAAREDAERMDFIERTYSGMTNRERYLPVTMGWGHHAMAERCVRRATSTWSGRPAMVERQEVEALVREIEEGCREHSCTPHDMSIDVEGDTLAALCRAWLAVDEAPVRNVVGGQWDDVFAREGNVVWCSDLHPGQRVRIVKEVGDD